MGKTAYLTIDDGPSPDLIRKLAFLDERRIRALHFFRGDQMELRPALVIETIRRGHVIGNHSYSHARFKDLSLEQCYQEIRRADTILEELYRAAGVARPHRLFRFPYGDKGVGAYDSELLTLSPADRGKRDALQRYLRQLGYEQPPLADVSHPNYRAFGYADDVDCHWTFDTRDWSVTKGLKPLDEILARLDLDAPERWLGLNDPTFVEIILLHDHDDGTAFTAIVDRLIEKGIQLAMPL